jgi:hypothetical protein
LAAAPTVTVRAATAAPAGSAIATSNVVATSDRRNNPA